MYKQTIGIVGGFGGFATLDFFRRLLETFNTGYERDYPRIVMDNDFTMPSRTRALLYGEQTEKVIEMITKSVQNLIEIGTDKIVLVCGTAHWFLDEVYEKLPEAREKVIDIINVTGEKMRAENIQSCYIIAAEGTLKEKVFEKRLSEFGINAAAPAETDWPLIRIFIEAVKQNEDLTPVKRKLEEFIHDRVNESECVILGCTELAVLVDEEIKKRIRFEDPLENVLMYLKQTLV